LPAPACRRITIASFPVPDFVFFVVGSIQPRREGAVELIGGLSATAGQKTGPHKPATAELTGGPSYSREGYLTITKEGPAAYACECRRGRGRRLSLSSFRITQLNNRALKPGRDLRVARAVNTAPFRPSQQIPRVPRTDIRDTPALP
jgi:hypothetical protein